MDAMDHCRKPDDKNSHYIFAVGKNLTPKCNL